MNPYQSGMNSWNNANYSQAQNQQIGNGQYMSALGGLNASNPMQSVPVSAPQTDPALAAWNQTPAGMAGNPINNYSGTGLNATTNQPMTFNGPGATGTTAPAANPEASVFSQLDQFKAHPFNTSQYLQQSGAPGIDPSQMSSYTGQPEYMSSTGNIEAMNFGGPSSGVAANWNQLASAGPNGYSSWLPPGATLLSPQQAQAANQGIQQSAAQYNAITKPLMTSGANGGPDWAAMAKAGMI